MRPVALLLVVIIASLAPLHAADPARRPEPVAQLDAPLYDLVLRNGMILDGSGNPWHLGGDALANLALGIAILEEQEIRVGVHVDETGSADQPLSVNLSLGRTRRHATDRDDPRAPDRHISLELGEGTSAGPYQGKLPQGKELRWTTRPDEIAGSRIRLAGPGGLLAGTGVRSRVRRAGLEAGCHAAASGA